MADDRRSLTKHGFPKGFRFVPTPLELITILNHVVHGRPLHPKVDAIFHDLNILDYHPDELHGMYERYKEHRFIYFFSNRQLQRSAEGGPVHKKRQRGAGQDEDQNDPRPVRLARGGGWKPSGGGIAVCWPKDKGGFVAGRMVTMVFYDHRDGGEQAKSKQDKSQWCMHEFTIPVDPRQLPDPIKPTRAKNMQLHGLALYRLYRLKSDGTESGYDGAGSSNQAPASLVAAAAHGRHLKAPCPAGQPSPFGIFAGRNQNQPLAPPPPPQHHMPNVGHPQLYHHQYPFGAAHQQVRTMTMPPAYGAGMLPARQLTQYARPPGTWFPGRQPLQFARPPAPSQMPVLPAAVNPAPSHQQAPAKATYGGAGQEASHSKATCSPLPSAPVSTPPPAAEHLAPMMAATHGGDFGATRPSPATGSRPAEQDAAATAEPGQHVQFSDCVIKLEETLPPPIPADNYDLDMGGDLGVFGDNCLFTMDELFGDNFLFDDPPPTQQGDGN